MRSLLLNTLFVRIFNKNAFPLLALILFPVLFPLHGEELSIGRLHFPEIQSTQTLAKEHAAELVDTPGKWVVITADHQTNGLGHQGRKWESSSDGNLYATFVTLYPKSKENDLFHVIQISALSVAKTLQDFCFEPQIKWINDIFLEKRKFLDVSAKLFPLHWKIIIICSSE